MAAWNCYNQDFETIVSLSKNRTTQTWKTLLLMWKRSCLVIKTLDLDDHHLRLQQNNKGLNALWQMDSYGKLKLYGVEVDSCFDGFSGHIQ